MSSTAQVSSPRKAKAKLTAGFKCAPDTGPKIKISTAKIAPVGSVLPSSADKRDVKAASETACSPNDAGADDGCEQKGDLPSAAKSIFTSIGTIISQINAATGKLTRAISAPPIAWKTGGMRWPSAMPAAMQSRHGSNSVQTST